MSGSLILTPTDGDPWDYFGQSVSLSSDGLTAIVGGRGDYVGSNSSQGSARVFVWNGTSWVQRGGALTPTDGASEDFFGWSVSLSSDGLVAIVGGRGDDVGSNTDQGSARVFVWNGTSWVQRGGALTPTDGAANDRFGTSVSLSSDGLTAIVGGAWDDVGSNSEQGSARVFVWNGTSWVQRGAALTPTDGAADDTFGQSVSLSSDGLTAIVGGLGDEVGWVLDQGSARVFVWNGTSWVQKGGALTPTDGAKSDYFGQSVSLSSDGLTAIVGGRGDDVGSNSEQGSARVFVWNGTSWVQRGGALTPTDGAASDYFGYSVSLSSDGFTAIVGGWGDDVGSNGGQGSARVFVWNGTSWVQRGDALTPTDGAANDRFGTSVALSSNGLTAIVGGDSDDVDGYTNQGSARLFSWNGTAWIEGVPAAATLAISASSATKPEGNTTTTDYTFLVTRSGYLTQATTVNWAVGGSGTNPASADDFLNGAFPTGSVTFASGETTQLITVKAAGDSSYELNEGFTVTLSNPNAGSSITQGSATGLIQNDDARLSIAATSASKAEGHSGLTDLTFTVSRIGNTTQASTANWAVSGSGTNAASASDFANSILPSGTVNFLANETSKTITVRAKGDSTYEPNETFAVTLSAPSVGSSLGTATATGTILNDDTSLSIAAASAIKAEGNSGLTNYTFTVTRGGNITQASTANWAVSGSGTNKAVASDFENATLPTGTVSFAAGETSKTITIKVAGENLVEQDEGFTVTLSAASVGTSISTATANGLILNDDATVSIAATSATKLEGHAGSTPMTFTVTRSGYTSPAATVAWSVSGAGTVQATADDFVGKALPTGTVSFKAGETSKTITVAVAGDTTVETNEGFKVTLATPSAGLTIGTASATGLIQNDDARLSIAATSANQVEGNTGATTPFTFTVTRSGYLTQATTANWAVTGTGNNAANGKDFTGGSLPTGTISFATGETSKTITVNVNGDTTVELAEQFTVSLNAPSTGAVITTATAIGTIQADDVASTGGDQFEGGAGVDTFNGLDGDDVFIGGGGADRLTGGLGADLFKYLGLGDAPYFLLKMETIKDFSAAQGDRIDLSAIDANARTLFNDAFTFLGLADFSTTNATRQLIFDYNDDLNIGALFGSVNADAMPELAILLPGVSSLTAGSLIL